MMIFMYGTAVALLLVGAGLLFMNPEQCPPGYTQEQIDASRCIVGANIGLGLVYLLAIGVWTASAVAAVVRALVLKRRGVRKVG